MGSTHMRNLNEGTTSLPIGWSITLIVPSCLPHSKLRFIGTTYALD